jgi:hypothetical protein
MQPHPFEIFFRYQAEKAGRSVRLPFSPEEARRTSDRGRSQGNRKGKEDSQDLPKNKTT